MRFLLGLVVSGLIFMLPLATAATPLETLHGVKPGEALRVPIIMYHSIEDTPDNIWEITPQTLESDFAYLQANGYNTVIMQDLIDYVYQGKPLPPNPIMLTFDDGRASDLMHVAKMLEKYDFRATFAIIGREADRYTEEAAKNPNISYPHMTWCQIAQLYDSTRADIQSHTYDLHGSAGAGRRRGESIESYQSRLLADLKKLDDLFMEHIGKTTNTLVFPLGIFSDSTNDVLKAGGYLASLSAAESRKPIIVGNPDSLFALGRYNRPPGISSEKFFAKVLDKAE